MTVREIIERELVVAIAEHEADHPCLAGWLLCARRSAHRVRQVLRQVHAVAAAEKCYKRQVPR